MSKQYRLTQSERLHDYALSRETCITMKLHAHDLVSKLALWVSIFDQRELFRSRFSKSYGVDSLY